MSITLLDTCHQMWRIAALLNATLTYVCVLNPASITCDAFLKHIYASILLYFAQF